MAVGVAAGGAVDIGGGFVGAVDGDSPNGRCRMTTYGGWPATGVSNTLWLSAFPWDL